MSKHLTSSFAIIEANAALVNSNKISLTLAEIAAAQALTYWWHKKGQPKVMEIADREFQQLLGKVSRQHAWRVRRALQKKGLIQFKSSRGKCTRYYFLQEGESIPEDAPKRASGEAIRDKEALIAHMRHTTPAYENADLERHYNEFVIWHAQNAPDRVLTPRAFRKWMRRQEEYGFYPRAEKPQAPAKPTTLNDSRFNSW